MKVLVLGATGGTGREICREAAAKGHSVVALVRSVARAQDLTGATLVEGDALDEAALRRALAGCSGVVSSLGTSVSPFNEVTLLSTATRALVKVMTRLLSVAFGPKTVVDVTELDHLRDAAIAAHVLRSNSSH